MPSIPLRGRTRIPLLKRHLVAAVVLCVPVVFPSCRDATVIPDTPLGHIASDWLAAHNRAEGHAAVHFTLAHQGTLRMSGAQVDSLVYASVKFAQDVGPFTPVRLLHSSDTSLTILFRSRSAGDFTARFKPVAQPAQSQVTVEVDRAQPRGE
jgi:hypothetical protein